MFPEGRILDFLLVGVIALIVVGPKDLPILMRRVGEFVGKLRSMAAEFRASFDEMARQSELEELRKEVEAMRAGQSVQGAARGALGLGEGEAGGQVFDDIKAGLAEAAPGSGAAGGVSAGYAFPSRFESPAEPADEGAPPAEAPRDAADEVGGEVSGEAAADAEPPTPARAAP